MSDRTRGLLDESAHPGSGWWFGWRGRSGAGKRGQAREQRRRAKGEVAGGAVWGRVPPRVSGGEGRAPPYGSGHWLPEMVQFAGGMNVLSQPGEYSFATTWQD